MRTAWLAAATALVAMNAAAQPAIDFTTTAGLEQTCRRYAGAQARALRDDAEKVAFAICGGIELLRVGARGMRDPQVAGLQGQGAIQHIRALLEDALARIVAARTVLETVKGPGPYMRIEPGAWAIDLDGDGIVSPQERYFFWVPRRGESLALAAANVEEYYRGRFVPPVIRVDRSDVYWAIAYCHFAEAALNLLLAYDIGLAPQRVELRDPERIRVRAYRGLLQGIAYSKRLRESLAAETDDDAEWIPNPRQANTAFPLVMDAQTFVTWGELLAHLELLAAGKTLLGGATGGGGLPVRDLAGGMCPPGQGINVRELFIDPVRQPLERSEWRARCRRPDAKLPLTGLAQLIQQSLERNAGRGPQDISGEWMILRHLYWVN